MTNRTIEIKTTQSPPKILLSLITQINLKCKSPKKIRKNITNKKAIKLLGSILQKWQIKTRLTT